MKEPIPLVVVCWLFLTCWTTTSASSTAAAAVKLAEVGDARQRRDIRRIDPVPDPGEWKPIDYGHPMRDDPTLVYVPPVVDPIHYGIHSAEPLWPIRGSKLPPFRLPPEAMLAAASNDQRRRWRPQPASKPKDVTLPRTSIQPSRQRLDHVSNLLVQRPAAVPQQQHQAKTQQQHPVKPQYLRHPVKSTAWENYDRSTNRPIGRSPAVVPSLQLPAVTGRHWTRHQASPVRHQSAETRASINRFFGGASSGRSFGNTGLNLESGRSSNGGISNSIIHTMSKTTESRSLDRVDNSLVPLLLDQQQSVATDEPNETLLSQPTNHQQRKRARRPFSPLEFVIQQGHSRVRKYGIQK